MARASRLHREGQRFESFSSHHQTLMSLEQIISLLTAYKYFLLFPIVVVEGPIVTVIAGFLVSIGRLDFFTSYLVIVLGDLVGDSMYYSFGYYGREKFVEKWGRFLGITEERVLNLEKHFEKHSGKTLVIGKLTHAVGGVLLVAAGMAKMPFWKFFIYNVISTLPKSLLILVVGFYFGKAYAQINSYFDYLALFFIGVVVIGGVIYFVLRVLKRRRRF